MASADCLSEAAVAAAPTALVSTAFAFSAAAAFSFSVFAASALSAAALAALAARPTATGALPRAQLAAWLAAAGWAWERDVGRVGLEDAGLAAVLARLLPRNASALEGQNITTAA